MNKYKLKMNATVARRNRLRRLQKKWNPEEDKIMVKMIEERPAIWNYDSPQYRDNDIKAKCWTEIAEQTNHSVADAKIHWNTVKSRFNLERRKVLQSRIGQAGEIYNPTYELYQPLQFLTTVDTKSQRQAVPVQLVSASPRPPKRKATNLNIKTESEKSDIEDSRSQPATSEGDDIEIITTTSSNKQKRKSFAATAPQRNHQPQPNDLLGEITDLIRGNIQKRQQKQNVTPSQRWRNVFTEYISCELDRYEEHDAQELKNQILAVCLNFQPEPCVIMESSDVE